MIFKLNENLDKEYENWVEVKSKQVPDYDGFLTDYTWYKGVSEDGDEIHIFMFGDKDVYEPDRDYADWECETQEQAEGWFDNYKGFEEEDHFEEKSLEEVYKDEEGYEHSESEEEALDALYKEIEKLNDNFSKMNKSSKEFPVDAIDTIIGSIEEVNSKMYQILQGDAIGESIDLSLLEANSLTSKSSTLNGIATKMSDFLSKSLGKEIRAATSEMSSKIALGSFGNVEKDKVKSLIDGELDDAGISADVKILPNGNLFAAVLNNISLPRTRTVEAFEEDALTEEEKSLCDYMLDNCREEGETSEDLLKKMRVYRSAYAKLAREKEDAVRDYFEDSTSEKIDESLNEDTVKQDAKVNESITDFDAVGRKIAKAKGYEYIGYEKINDNTYGFVFDTDEGETEIGFTTEELKPYLNTPVTEGTIKQGNSWVNKGKEGTHGKFRTKKAADAQRKAMFANGFKEALDEDDEEDVDESLEESLDDEVEFSEFEIEHPERNKNFDKEKYGKYFDREGKLIPEKEEEYFDEISDDDFDWDEDKIEEALNNFTPDNSQV